jgi:hypothetical protein
VVAVEEVSFASKINIHPNPFCESLVSEYELSQPGNVRAQFINHLGKQVDAIKERQKK